MNETTASFSIDARTILSLGRQSIRDHSTALIELVKNSYDADATYVRVSLNSNSIVIADNGTGMTRNDVLQRWLRIGFSAKRQQTRTTKNRRRTGEKGIGRISADRLGARLSLITRSAQEPPVSLLVDWNAFDVDGKDLNEVNVYIGEPESVDFPDRDGKSPTGTILHITEIRETWHVRDIERLREELALLTPPFGAVRDFSVWIDSDLPGAPVGEIESPFMEVAEVELDARLQGSTVEYEIRDRIGMQRSHTPGKRKITWKKLLHRVGVNAGSDPHTGPVNVRLRFYPRKAEILKGTDFRLSDLREFLSVNAGVKIYRDDVRVKPYGDPRAPEGDWLGLAERKTRDPAGVGRAGFRVAPNQLVGAVFVSRDENPRLVDSAGREGLIENEAFGDLRSLVVACLRLLEEHRHEAYSEKPERNTGLSPQEEIRDLQADLRTLKKDLSGIKGRGTPNARAIERALDQVSVVGAKIESASASLEELLSQAGVLRGLATVGIASSVFGHETQSALAGFVQSTYAAKELLEDQPPDAVTAHAEITKAIDYASQVEGWGHFALTRVRRDKRRKRAVDIETLAEGVVAGLITPFVAASIDLVPEVEAVKIRAFPMDLEAIIINLLTNAYVACQQEKRSRVVRLAVKPASHEGKDGVLIAVSDTGPGVEPSFAERIWKPLFTSKQDDKGRDVGTGLGLSIVQAVVEESGGWRSVDQDPQLKGARFRIWLPK